MTDPADKHARALEILQGASQGSSAALVTTTVSIELPVSPLWRLYYGWIEHRQKSAGGTNIVRPPHITCSVFHSFEACIKTYPTYSWWEVTDPNGTVVLSSRLGFDSAACPNPSLCVRQILNDRSGLFPESVEGIDDLDLQSHDDGATWEPVLLGAKSSSSNTANGSAKPRAVTIDGLRLGPHPTDSTRALIEHRTGRVSIPLSSLEIRESSTGRPDLYVIDKGCYSVGVSAEVVTNARSLGVVIRAQGKGVNGASKSWKPGIFKIHMKDESLGPTVIRGFTRGDLGIDFRLIDVKGYTADFIHKRNMWCLTHIPTGLSITSVKHRNHIEEIADKLREVVPELTDGGAAELTADIRSRAKAVLDEFN